MLSLPRMDVLVTAEVTLVSLSRHVSGQTHEPTVRRFAVSPPKIADCMKHELNIIPSAQSSKVEFAWVFAVKDEGTAFSNF